MISPSPTQPPQKAPAPEEQKVVRATPSRRRAGETPLARLIKAILRPIIKLFYYLIRAIRTHKLLTLAVILLLIASVSATTYVTTGSFPFGIGRDPFNFQVHGGNGGGSYVQNWLYALRDGDLAKLELLQAGLSSQQAPDPSQAISQYSQPQGHLSWTSINLIANYNQPDGSVDSFVSVEVSGNGPGGAAKGVMVWHFITDSTAQGRILEIDLVSFRPVA